MLVIFVGWFFQSPVYNVCQVSNSHDFEKEIRQKKNLTLQYIPSSLLSINLRGDLMSYIYFKKGYFCTILSYQHVNPRILLCFLFAFPHGTFSSTLKVIFLKAMPNGFILEFPFILAISGKCLLSNSAKVNNCGSSTLHLGQDVPYQTLLPTYCNFHADRIILEKSVLL